MDQQYSTFVLSRIFAPAKRISTTTVLTAQNFADNKTTDASPEIRNFFFWRISGKFDIITFAQRCKTTNCHYCWKRIGNVFLVVWSTASFASLIIHTTGLEDSPSERRISRVVSRDFWWPLLLDCKTVRIFAYSRTREQSNKRSGKSGTRLKTESETGERR